MKPQKIYEIFTEALGNENIKAELIEILAGKAEEDHIEGQTELFPSTDDAVLAAENTALSRKIALLELEVGRLESENAAIVTQLKRCKSSLDEYCSAYAMQISLYEKFRTLSEETAEAVRKCFPNDTLSGIFICGVQKENLARLRNITEGLILESYAEKRKDIAVLNELYAYLLSCLNSAYQKPLYKLTEVKAGDSFDEKLHRSPGGKKSGRISAVLMQGCVSAENAEVIRRAIVEL